MFIESIQRTEEHQASKSCTIFINGQKACIKDGDWYDCPEGHSVEDFVRLIKNAYKQKAKYYYSFPLKIIKTATI